MGQTNKPAYIRTQRTAWIDYPFAYFPTALERPLWGDSPVPAPAVRLMDQVSTVCRRGHLSRRTEAAYRFWIRQYIRFHQRRHPREVGTLGIAPFVNYLATHRQVAASTQSQALNAVLFLYRDVLELDIGHLQGLRRVAYQTWTDGHTVRREYSRTYHCTDNAYIESFNGILRKEVLRCYNFGDLAVAQRMLDDWRMRYNLSRPHFALGGLSPVQYTHVAALGQAPKICGRYSQKSPDFEEAAYL